MELFIGLGILTLALAVLISPALGALVAKGHLLQAALTALIAWIVPVINLYRYRRAPGGCLALVLGFGAYLAAYAAKRPLLECALALGLPNVLFALGEPLLRSLRERAALSALSGLSAAAQLAPFLANRSPLVRTAAATKLSACAPDQAAGVLKTALASEGLARDAAWESIRQVSDVKSQGPLHELLTALAHGADVALAAPAALALATKWPAGDDVAALLDEEVRPAVRAALGEGLLPTDAARASEVLVGVLSDSAVPEPTRQAALDALEPIQASDALGEAVRAAAASGVSPELLWLLAEHGQPAQAEVAANQVAADSYALANAAVEAVGGIWNRAQDLGEHTDSVRQALANGRTAIREVHPPGDNRLADGLVTAIEELEQVLTTPPASEDAAE